MLTNADYVKNIEVIVVLFLQLFYGFEIFQVNMLRKVEM